MSAAKVLQNRIKYAEYVRNVFAVNVEPGTPLSTVLDPTYWLHVAKQFKAMDRIEVQPEDGAWWAELFVRNIGPLGVHVELMRTHHQAQAPSAEPPAEDSSSPFTIKFGGADKWRVIRNADGEVLSRKHNSRHDAEAWLAAHTEPALV